MLFVEIEVKGKRRLLNSRFIKEVLECGNDRCEIRMSPMEGDEFHRPSTYDLDIPYDKVVSALKGECVEELPALRLDSDDTES